MAWSGKRPAAGLLLGVATLGCDPKLDPGLPDFRRQAVDAVSPRFDARGARFETHRAKSLFVVKVWMREGSQGAERLRATCWFDDQRRLQTVVYAD